MNRWVSENFTKYYDEKRTVVEKYLKDLSMNRPQNIPKMLWDSMMYSLLAGGKRVRPVLAMTVGEIFGLKEEVLPLAVALEMIHTASLVHDDMPCMDNDSLRRGKPTNHIVYGESMALLAGDALFLYAIEQALKNLNTVKSLQESNIINALNTLLEAAGPSGICGGQAMDISESSNFSFSPWKIAYFKTATLLKASVISPAQLAGALEFEIKALTSYASHLGITFQIIDDVLDVIGEKTSLGKNPGKDKTQGKKTFVELYGLEKSIELARLHSKKSIDALRNINRNTAYLASFAAYLESRTH
ncbi:MAG: polyprenyl synthetase family protein [Thermovirga sp.]|nr:polyprenyl synthetase family protein [Thermovirga sp.]